MGVGSSRRRARRVMVIVGGILVAGILVLLGALLLLSPGKPAHLADKDGRPLPGSISDKIRLNINGVDQGMFIEGKDVRNPVLLFMHGGAGMPERCLTRNYPTGLADGE